MNITDVQVGLCQGKAYKIEVELERRSRYKEFLTPLDDTRCLSEVSGETDDHGWGGSAEMLISDLAKRHPQKGWVEIPAQSRYSKLDLWEQGLIE